MRERVILDLCGGTGAWSHPYQAAGYTVRMIDLPRDVRLERYDPTLVSLLGRVHGMLCAPPCTVFSYARNRHPPTDVELREALSVVDACLRAVVLYQPVWWALENPCNKLRRYLGPPTLTFRHWQYGDAKEKPTALWGDFTPPRMNPRPRRTPSTYKTRRPNAVPTDAITGPCFARAFFEANP